MTRRNFARAALVIATACAAPPPSRAPKAKTEPVAASTTIVGTRPTPNASAISPAPPASPCTGSDVSIMAALEDPRCAIPDAEGFGPLRSALEAEPVPPLRFSAALVEGESVDYRIENVGTAPLVLPLREHSEVDLFPVVARSAGATHPAPVLQLHAADPDRATSLPFTPPPTGHFAKITLASGGVAHARLRLVADTKNESVAHCRPDEKCAPRIAWEPLPRGTYNLEIRSPVHTTRQDAVARLSWTVR